MGADWRKKPAPRNAAQRSGAGCHCVAGPQKWQQRCTSWECSKVFYGQEPPSSESNTTECEVNYQLLAVIYWSRPIGNSWLQSTTTATDNGVRDGKSNWLAAPYTLMGSTPWAPRIARCKRGLQIARFVAATGARTRVHGYARRTQCLCGHSG